MIPNERASRYKSGYQIDGKDTVTFNPPLEVKEWEELMAHQEVALQLAKGLKKAKEEKKDGKEKTEQTSESKKPEQD